MSYIYLRKTFKKTIFKYFVVLIKLSYYILATFLIFMVYFIIQILAPILRFLGYDPLKMKYNNHKTYKEYKKDSKIDLLRMY